MNWCCSRASPAVVRRGTSRSLRAPFGGAGAAPADLSDARRVARAARRRYPSRTVATAHRRGSRHPRRPPMATTMTRSTKFILPEDQIPRSWYNIAADLPTPPPPVLHPGTGEPIGPGDLAPLFPMELIKQVVSQDRYIEIPDQVREAYTPLPAEPALPRAPAREGARYARPHLLQVRGRQPVGQPQAEHGDRRRRSTTRRRASPGSRPRPAPASGAARSRSPAPFRARGQGLHGPRELRPEAVPPDPDGDVRRAGRAEPSLGHAVRPEAPRREPGPHRARSASPSARRSRTPSRIPGPSTRSGSVFDFVLLHQTVIGQESIEQMGMAGEEPDVIIGCAGGGSNFAGPRVPVARPRRSAAARSTASSPPSRRPRRS